MIIMPLIRGKIIELKKSVVKLVRIDVPAKSLVSRSASCLLLRIGKIEKAPSIEKKTTNVKKMKFSHGI